MADRDDQSNVPTIPDGGLTDAMPDWLRRPPAWRTLPEREVTLPKLDDAADLPEADDSVIDPRTFLSDDDLPAWLRELGSGRTSAATPATVPNEAVQPPVPATADSSRSSTTAPRFVPASPPVLISTPSGGRQQIADRAQPRISPVAASDSRGNGLVSLLAALLLIAIVVIVVLIVA